MRFIHIADVHLGMEPDADFPWGGKRKQELWDAFEGVITRAKETKPELLLIAGDLFHGQPLLRELKEVAYLLEQIPDTTVVLIAGNHDHLKSDSNYLKVTWPSNVIGLWEEDCQVCYLDHLNTYIYGFSYGKRENEAPIYNQLFPGGQENFQTENPDAMHILVAHGGDEKHIPIQYSALEGADFDYIALGHIHKPEIFPSGKMAYAGSLEPLDKNHFGQRGYIEGSIENGETKITFIPVAKREYIPLIITVTPQDTTLSIRDEIMKQIDENGSNNIYRITLEGYRSPDISFAQEEYEGLGLVVEFMDNTEPDYDFSQLQKQYAGTVIGDYIASFSTEDTLTNIEKKALYYGVHALLEARE